jgi:hypothetical protein
MKNIIKLSALALAFTVGSCNLLDLDANLENPNEVSVEQLNPDLLMNTVQLEFADFVAEANIPSMELSRMMSMTGGDEYQRAYQAQDFNDIWERGYQDVVNQIETLLETSDASGRSVHAGAARVMKAYVMLTMVDLFGDVPFSEAVDALNNFNPKADGGAAIYQGCIALLDQAIADLNQTTAIGLGRDIYYSGNKTKWIALANTLKLKAYMNLRLTDSSAKANIETLLGADLIDTDAEEFTYKYGTADIPARSRHPQYRDMYKPQAGDGDTYIGNYFMYQAYQAKGKEDPRWRYYFYRQVGSIAKALDDDPESIPCLISPRPSHYDDEHPYCAFDPGFFGRDHGNNDGVPPDTRAKTCIGVYPVGGRADVNNGDDSYQVVTQQGQGANGAGIQPIWMASFTEFLKAEAYLSLGIAGDAKAAMLSGVNKSIERVRAFAGSKGQALPAGLEASQTAYTDTLATMYDAAASDADRLLLSGKEYYLALWGNGIEAYNLFRRTGAPGNIQPMRAANPGNFIRSLLYPADYVNLNSNATQKSNTAITKVFWDNNPDNFIY